MEIYPEHLKEPEKPPKKFVYRYDLLNNDLLLNELQNHEKCSLPPPDYDEITPNYENLCRDRRYTFRELLNGYIQNEITMALYGQELLKSFLKNKVHQMMDMEKEIAVGRFSTKSHLQNHRKYLQLSNSYYTTKIITFVENIKAIIFAFFEEKNYRKRPEENPALLIIFPLPKFSFYTKTYNPWKELLFPNSSPFCDYEYSELYKCFYVLFFSGRCYINELPQITQESPLITTIILGILHLGLNYGNLFIHHHPGFPILGIILHSFVWLKLLVLIFAMIIGVAQSVFSFLVILVFFVFAFAHSLHILLRPITNFSLSQPGHSNDSNDPWNLVTAYYSISGDGTASKNATLTEFPNTCIGCILMLAGILL
ncbi:transient receptor potential cation channel subfamily a member 1-like [Gigaspora margarita]|uniref:Transient receptor potential cation channel subfamily a member 1-like n=1 Tax=Gigaspora margarita TaxID=4874 RepID=A0A8H4APR1_GIGMA|nr:transient receptor potential cation channel subfamily a member 1-like [Gigaspora margarita]